MGPEGPEGYLDTDAIDFGQVESEISEVRSFDEELDSDLSNVESDLGYLCIELDVYC
jgi:hypothetical protein